MQERGFEDYRQNHLTVRKNKEVKKMIDMRNHGKQKVVSAVIIIVIVLAMVGGTVLAALSM